MGVANLRDEQMKDLSKNVRKIPCTTFNKFVSHYKTVSIIFFSGVLLLLVLNVALYTLNKIRKSVQENNNPVSNKYNSNLTQIYPGLTENEINKLLSETWSRHLFEYEPFTQFRERPYSGEYVNISKNGYRITRNQGPWPPEPENSNIFIFGGSTTFGYGLPDSETLASYLQEYLGEDDKLNNIYVYNFGRGYYYSTQEKLLFEKLLMSDFVPDLAIFVDGLNEYLFVKDVPQFSGTLANMMDPRRSSRNAMLANSLLHWLPMGRAILYITEKLENNINVKPDVNTEMESTLQSVIKRYCSNKKMIDAIAESMNVNTLFVWQPVPWYKYDLKYHFKGKLKQSAQGYPLMKEHLQIYSLGKNFLWSADIQENIDGPGYVDLVHYNAKLTQMLARHIAQHITHTDILQQK